MSAGEGETEGRDSLEGRVSKGGLSPEKPGCCLRLPFRGHCFFGLWFREKSLKSGDTPQKAGYFIKDHTAEATAGLTGKKRKSHRQKKWPRVPHPSTEEAGQESTSSGGVDRGSHRQPPPQPACVPRTMSQKAV